MKGLAVPYIIAILFGVLIFGVIGYWMYSQSGKAFGTGSKTECDAQRRSYCTFWKNTGFGIKPGFSWSGSCKEPSGSECVEEVFKLGIPDDCICAPKEYACSIFSDGIYSHDYGISCEKYAGTRYCCKE